MLINVVVKRTSDGKFIGYNVLIHDVAKEETDYTARIKINMFEGVDFYVASTANRYSNLLPVIRFLKNNMDIFEYIESSIDEFAKFLAVTLSTEFNCTARAGKD